MFCCTTRGAVFFLASNHIFFAVTQILYILPVVVGGTESKTLESSLAFLFCILFFSTGFMTFRGADEESSTLIRLGGICIPFVLIFRFVLHGLQLMLVETIPEASFLYTYENETVPFIFTVCLYTLYLVILFCYYKELKSESASNNNQRRDSGIDVRRFNRPKPRTL